MTKLGSKGINVPEMRTMSMGVAAYTYIRSNAVPLLKVVRQPYCIVVPLLRQLVTFRILTL